MEISNSELIQFILREMHYKMRCWVFLHWKNSIPHLHAETQHKIHLEFFFAKSIWKWLVWMIQPLAGSTLKPSLTQSQCQLSGIPFSTKPFWIYSKLLFCDGHQLSRFSPNTMSVALNFPAHHGYPHCWVWPPGMWVCTCVHMPVSWHTWRCQSRVLGVELTPTMLVEKRVDLLCHLGHQPSRHI